MVGRHLPFFSVLVPFWLVAAMVGLRRMREVWPAYLTAGLSFAIVQFLVSNLHGPWLVDIVASIASILSMVVLLRFWQPREIWRFDDDRPVEEERAGQRRPGPATGELSPGPGAAARSELPASSDRREAFMAWLSWILLAVLVFLWGTPQVKSFLNEGVRDALISGIRIWNPAGQGGARAATRPSIAGGLSGPADRVAALAPTPWVLHP